MLTSKNPSRRPDRSSVLVALACWLGAATAHAGPAEVISHVTVGASNPDQLALPYYYGGAGIFLSADAGATFSLVCSSAIDPSLVREQDVYTTLVTGSGSVLLAGPTGLWTGQPNGCGWTEATELKGTWISDVASDPTDPKRSYALTSVMGGQNGLRVNDGASPAWTPLGATAALQLGTLFVAKTSAGKIFYTRGVQAMGAMLRYVIRVSEDEAKTWMEFEFPRPEAQDVRIVAVDPADPTRIVVAVVLDADKAILPNQPDELWFSTMRGAAGSFMKIAPVGILRGAAFGSDGTLYYGDDATDTPGLYAVKKLGDMPMKVGTKPVSCLRYDAGKKRLYGCTGNEFGTFDPMTGDFQSLFDKRKASQFAECAGQAPMAMRCKEQLALNYCGYGHFWQAPLCATYMLPGSPYDPALMSGGAAGGGMATTGAPAGAAGSMANPVATAGTGATAGAAPVGSAGTAAAAPVTPGATPGAPPPPASGGCSCVIAGSDSNPRGLGIAALALVAGVLHRRGQRRKRLHR